jgi:hypothetical protein
MKKILAILIAVLVLANASSARAGGFYISTGVKGLVTGALVGSVFGPNKKVRAKNAVIGAVSGYIIGNQYANSQKLDNIWSNRHKERGNALSNRHKERGNALSNRHKERGNGRSNRHKVKHLVVAPHAAQQTVVIYQNQPVDYWQETRTVYTSPGYGSQTIIIERQSPVVIYKSNYKNRNHKRYRKRRHHKKHGIY